MTVSGCLEKHLLALQGRPSGGDADASIYQLAADAVGQKVSPSVIGKNLTRIVGEQIYPDGVEMPDRGMAPVL